MDAATKAARVLQAASQVARFIDLCVAWPLGSLGSTSATKFLSGAVLTTVAFAESALHRAASAASCVARLCSWMASLIWARSLRNILAKAASGGDRFMK